MKSGRLQIWVPELIAREGGIQSYSIEMVEAAAEILGPGRVTVLSKSDDPKALRERFGAKVKTYATGNIPGLLRTPTFALMLVAVAERTATGEQNPASQRIHPRKTGKGDRSVCQAL